MSIAIPDPLKAEWLFTHLPLYTRVPLDDKTSRTCMAAVYLCGNIDCYCLGCQKESVFEGTYPQPLVLEPPPVLSGVIHTAAKGTGIVTRELRCRRVGSHRMTFHFHCTEAFVQKVGQFPSLADLQKPKLLKYRKVLGDQRYRELARGVGCYAHGIGIGAFVYLRRIFESLVEDAHAQAAKAANWDEAAFQRQRMPERIKLLSTLLPSFLVEHAGLYGIMSKGVHELTENECLLHFDAMLTGIEIILDEELHQREREEKAKGASSTIKALYSKLGGAGVA